MIHPSTAYGSVCYAIICTNFCSTIYNRSDLAILSLGNILWVSMGFVVLVDKTMNVTDYVNINAEFCIIYILSVFRNRKETSDYSISHDSNCV